MNVLALRLAPERAKEETAVQLTQRINRIQISPTAAVIAESAVRPVMKGASQPLSCDSAPSDRSGQGSPSAPARKVARARSAFWSFDQGSSPALICGCVKRVRIHRIHHQIGYAGIGIDI